MRRNLLTWLVFGDLMTFLIVTVVGFASHQELGVAGWRLLTTFIPLCVAWALSAPMLGLYSSEVYHSLSQLWKPPYGMILAGPLAVLLRGIWLNRPIVPIFAVVLTAVGMLGIFLWRFLFWWLIVRRFQDG